MDLIGAFEKMFPVLFVFFAGVVIARKNYIGAASSGAFANYAFLLAIPCYLFKNLYEIDLQVLFQWNALIAYVCSATICLLFIGFLAARANPSNSRAVAIRIMAGVQVNTAYFAIPIFIMLFGNAAPILPVLLFQVCILSAVVIAIMEFSDPRSEKVGSSGKLIRSAVASLNTPVILACNAAIAFNLLSIHVPAVVLDGFSFVGDSASPVALFALGLHLGGSTGLLRKTSMEEAALIGFKCVLFPVITYLVASTVFSVDKSWLAYLVLIAAMPSPQNLFIFAQRYDVEVDLSASIVVKSSIASLILMPFWAWWTISA